MGYAWCQALLWAPHAAIETTLLPVPGLYWSDAGSIGPVQTRYWQLLYGLHMLPQEIALWGTAELALWYV